MKRIQLELMKKRIEKEPRKHLQVIFGPRQVGKTTLVRQLMESTVLPSHYASADGVAGGHDAWISQQWETARIKMQSAGTTEALLVLDEIQKINNWSEYVKLEWDADTAKMINLKVILLGSSRLLLQQGLKESLTGRYETLYMPHWSYSEMKALTGMSVEKYIWFGGYPGAAALMEDEQRWKNYMLDSIIESSISRDILMLTKVDKPALIRQLFELGCSYSGQILSFNKILGQMTDAGNTTTLSHYLRLLDQAGLLAGLPKYSPDIIRQRASIPKYQVHNMALKSALEPEHFHQVRYDSSKWGRWVESAIGTHLINQCLLHHCKLYYWRDGNDEVDFVIEGKGKTIGIEVKSSAIDSTKGISAFKKRYDPNRILLVGPTGIPVEEFLELEIFSLFN
jgi:predicted AAA+ superfamily ATPase